MVEGMLFLGGGEGVMVFPHGVSDGELKGKRRGERGVVMAGLVPRVKGQGAR